jgi:flavin-dependent dehydrogenase
VRRIEFDHALARAARARGIDVQDGVRVTDLFVRDDGVTLETSAGALEAEVVVGADGVGSFVRRRLGFGTETHRAQAVEVDTEPVDSDLDRGLILFDLSRAGLAGYYWDFPTVVEGRPLMCRGVYWLKSFGGAVPVEIDDILTAELESRGLDPSRYKRKRYAERGHVRGGPVSVRRALLVGEAAGIDPITGEGIAQAIQYGSAAGPYLARKLARSDFDFGDYAASLGGASIGRDLAVRTAAVGLAYGKYRGAVERYLLDTPEFLEVGLAHFAGKPWSKRALSRATLRAAVATAKRLALGDGL